MKIPEISGVHRPPEGQGQNGVTRAQSWTGGGWRLGVADMAKISKFFFRNITIHNFIRILCHVGFSILQVV